MKELLKRIFTKAEELLSVQFDKPIRLYNFVQQTTSQDHGSYTPDDRMPSTICRLFSASRTLFLIFAVLLLWSCKKDKGDDTVIEVNTVPKVSLSNEVIITSLGSDFFIEADLADSAGIKSFTLRYDDWYLYNTVPLEDIGYPKTYHVKYKFRMPDTAANKIHSLELIATNRGNKETTSQVKVMLNTDFPKMYLTESLDATKLTNDLFGVPMLIDKTSSYNYSAKYYSAAPNSKIWFIPSKTAAKPFAYGVDPKDNSKLSGDAKTALAITLPEKGYYSITYNTFTLNYTITKLANPNPANAFPQVALAGRGFYDYPTMEWQNDLPNIILMDKDSDNPYLFTKTVKLGLPAGKSYSDAQFIFTTNNGWTNFWRFDKGSDPETTVFNGGDTGSGFAISNTPVVYKVTFDTYLNRAKFERQ